MAGQIAIKTGNVGTFNALIHTSDVNYFTNQPYAIKNLTHRERQIVPPTRFGQQHGDTVEFDVPKTVDYLGRWQLETVHGPWAAPAPSTDPTFPCFIDGAGYRLIENVTVNFTNKRLNSANVPYWWNILLHGFCRDVSYKTFIGANHGGERTPSLSAAGSVNQSVRNTWLVNGYTFLSELETGFQHHSRENYILISCLSSRLNIKVKLAPVSAIVAGFTGVPSNKPASWIPSNGLNLILNAVHINPHERKRELHKHDRGVFNLIRVFDTQLDVFPNTTSILGLQSATIDLKFTGNHECVFFIFKPTFQLREDAREGNDPCVFMPADNADPAFSQTLGTAPATSYATSNYYVPRYSYGAGPTTYTSATAYAIPNEWEFLFQNTPFHPRERIWHNLTTDRQHHFPGMIMAPNGVLALTHSETFQHDSNAILGLLDYNTASKRQVKFYWTNGSYSARSITGPAAIPANASLIPGSGSGTGAVPNVINAIDTLSCITIACGPDFVETIKSAMHAVFNNS